MKFKAIIFAASFVLLGFVQQNWLNNDVSLVSTKNPTTSTWTSIETAVELAKTNNKKILVDIYTDWCKWCKEMDKQTYDDPKIKKYIAANYNLAKLNAEQKASIQFKNKQYNWVQGDRRGYNELANHILDGRMAYPSLAIFDSELNKLEVIRGFKPPEQLMEILRKASL